MENEMKTQNVFVCSFSGGLDELPKKQQKNLHKILKILRENKRFSIFEATANNVIATTMSRLVDEGLITVTPSGFPWSDVVLTAKGESLLEFNECHHFDALVKPRK